MQQNQVICEASQYEVLDEDLLLLVKEVRFADIMYPLMGEMEEREEARAVLYEEAREAGLLEECQCCFSTDNLPAADMVRCKGDHGFCTNCASQGTDVVIGSGETAIRCFQGCGKRSAPHS